jgi:hypothetical protein
MRALGWLLILVGGAFLAADIVAWTGAGAIAPTPLGRVWFDLDRFSLNLAQVIVERYVAAALWQSAIGPALLQPGWVVFPALGICCLAMSRLFGLLRRRD